MVGCTTGTTTGTVYHRYGDPFSGRVYHFRGGRVYHIGGVPYRWF